MGPFKVPARTAPNTYPLDVPATWRTYAEFNVERLRPYLPRTDHLGGAAAPPPHVVGSDCRPEHEVRELLKFKWLVPAQRAGGWARHEASGDMWEPLDNPTNYEEAIAAFERATRDQALTAPAAPPRPAAAGLRSSAAADSAGRLHRGPCAFGQPSPGARRQDNPLLVAPGRVAARHCRTPLPRRPIPIAIFYYKSSWGILVSILPNIT